jgi:hypothetical protein
MQLYNFKVGDEVWHVSEPSRIGIVDSISKADDTVWVRWTSLSVIAYNNGVRPKTLSKKEQPHCVGRMKHTNEM